MPVDWLILGAGGVLLWMALLAFSEWRVAKRPALLPLLWLLRAGAVAALAFALAGPSRTLTRRESTRQAVSIYVDTSASMAQADPDAFVPSWTNFSPDDATAGKLAAARHHLRRLVAMPPGQWGTPAGDQRWMDAAEVMPCRRGPPGARGGLAGGRREGMAPGMPGGI